MDLSLCELVSLEETEQRERESDFVDFEIAEPSPGPMRGAGDMPNSSEFGAANESCEIHIAVG